MKSPVSSFVPSPKSHITSRAANAPESSLNAKDLIQGVCCCVSVQVGVQVCTRVYATARMCVRVSKWKMNAPDEIGSILLSLWSLNYQTSILNKTEHVCNYLVHNAPQVSRLSFTFTRDRSAAGLVQSSSGATDGLVSWWKKKKKKSFCPQMHHQLRDLV